MAWALLDPDEHDVNTRAANPRFRQGPVDHAVRSIDNISLRRMCNRTQTPCTEIENVVRG